MTQATALRARVKRVFCAHIGDACTTPEYPRGEGQRCKGFRCTRCKQTVGWCRGADHGDDHPANTWCDCCYCDVYAEPAVKAKAALRRFKRVTDVTYEDGPPNVQISTDYPGNPPALAVRRILRAVRRAGVTCNIYIDGAAPGKKNPQYD